MADHNQQGRICTGDCFACSFQQAWMCTSQHTLRILKAMDGLATDIENLKTQVAELQAKFADTPVPPIQAEPEPKKKK